MLIVESHSKRRADCGQVKRQLRELLERCNNSPHYTSEPSPRPFQDRGKEIVAVEAELNDEASKAIKNQELRIYSGKSRDGK
jgi:hypothetical protein